MTDVQYSGTEQDSTVQYRTVQYSTVQGLGDDSDTPPLPYDSNDS